LPRTLDFLISFADATSHCDRNVVH
jgi:hypothetical protein